MKKLKRIKLSNLDNSKLEKDQLSKVLGGGNPCYECQSCMGVDSYMNKSISKYRVQKEQLKVE